jgi:tetratricopeptide (TPR) repeat protein
VRPLRIAVVIVLSALACAAAPAGAAGRPIDALERAVAADPENLKLAADYRQLAIADKTFDRSIDFLEKLAKRRESGPNIQISLALAYVDKVPTSGDIRRLYLGRDAMSALTRAIERRPSVLAYYMRGVINLFYNNFIFNRVPRGIADLEKALALATPDTPSTLVRRVYTSIGDGQFKLGNAAKAREAWSSALARFPEDADLAKRLAEGADVRDIVTTALYASRRVDTTLEGLLSVR